MQELIAPVRCVREPALDAAYPAQWPATVRLTTRDGRSFFQHVAYPKGDPENPLDWPELVDKFRALTDAVLPPADAPAIIARAAALASLPSIRALTATLPRGQAVGSRR